ncbi:MAG TPA: ATP-grasp domain-containing protein [Tepidisphaeraceae bacterium]|nr:ATP-grasp domain-containing protein [Tepidisphaeraceae bacterium]
MELVHEPRLTQLGLEILAKLNYVGAVKLDFKKDVARDCYQLLEINTRFNLWNHLGAACGINLPYLACRDLYGYPNERLTHYQTGIRWLSFGNDFRGFLQDYHADGDLSWSQWLWSLRGPKIHDVFSWRDPRPWAVSMWRYLKAKWQKGMRILRRRPSASTPHPARAKTC